MSLPRIDNTTVLAPWSLRLGSLAAQLLVATAVLHRFAALPTAAAVNLMALSFAAAALAVCGGIAALVQIWRFGSAGTRAAAGALLLGAGLLFIPAYYLPVMSRSGQTADASTDNAHAPAFRALAKVRQAAGLDANATASGAVNAETVLEPVITNRTASDVFDLTNDLIRQLDFNVVAEQAPGFGEDDGSIEATDRTLVLGLVDDISIRISAHGGTTRVDVRSAARYPRLDLGRNEERVRLVVRKLQASIDASVPTDDAASPDAADTAGSAVKSPAGTSGAGTVHRRKK